MRLARARARAPGGHAAHFANIDQGSPLFSQERAPTSVAYAETQSMFLDALVGDADWLAKYARDRCAQRGAARRGVRAAGSTASARMRYAPRQTRFTGARGPRCAHTCA